MNCDNRFGKCELLLSDLHSPNEKTSSTEEGEVSALAYQPYTCAFKLKNDKLRQLHPGQGWVDLAKIDEWYRARITYPPTCDKVYILGGSYKGNPIGSVKTVSVLDVSNCARKFVTQMNTPRASFGCCYTWDGKIVVAGGISFGQNITGCEIYDVAADKWSKIPDLPEPRSDATITCLDKRYFMVVGGCNKSGGLNFVRSVELLEIASD